MYIETMISADHTELMKIFFEANELSVDILQKTIDIRGRSHVVLHFVTADENVAGSLTFMGLRNCGVVNMFEDYLMKCGVEWSNLNPSTYMRQLQEEREQEINEEFMKHFKGINRAHSDS